jgi:hypothetical protein
MESISALSEDFESVKVACPWSRVFELSNVAAPSEVVFWPFLLIELSVEWDFDLLVDTMAAIQFGFTALAERRAITDFLCVTVHNNYL